MPAEDDARSESTRTYQLLIGSDVDRSDAARAAAFLSLGSARLSRPWAVAEGAPASVQAMLSGLDDPPTLPSALGEPVVHLRLGETGREAPEGALRSPLQFDELIEALVQAEAVWERRVARAWRAAAVTVPDEFVDTVADAAAVADEPAPVPEPAANGSWAGMRFRLRRWPPSALLQASRYGVRLASFMSARFITLDELEQLSNVARSECAAVVLGFMDHALLHVRREGESTASRSSRAGSKTSPADTTPAPTPAPRAAAAAAPSPARTVKAPAQRNGLFSALRRRLGLATGR